MSRVKYRLSQVDLTKTIRYAAPGDFPGGYLVWLDIQYIVKQDEIIADKSPLPVFLAKGFLFYRKFLDIK